MCAIVQLTVQLWDNSPNNNDVSTEAEESRLLIAVTKQRPVKILQAGKDLPCSDL
jgi:hypothetical protein